MLKLFVYKNTVKLRFSRKKTNYNINIDDNNNTINENDLIMI